MNIPKYVILHHSWSKDNPNLSDWEAIKKYHIEVMGWKTVGYHFGLDYVNNIVVIKRGREVFEEGAHAIDFNARSIGICIVGNYDEQPLQIDKQTKLISLIRALQLTFNISTSNVIGHRETYALRGVPQEKSCPGNQINMDTIRNLIQ